MPELMTTLDTLEDYLSEYQYLINSFNKSYLLLTRFKLNYGQDGIELLLHEMLKNSGGGDIVSEDDETIIRQRKQVDKHIDNHINSDNHSDSDSDFNNFPLLTKRGHIDTLKSTFHSLLRNKIVPLALLKRKLEEEVDIGAEIDIEVETETETEVVTKVETETDDLAIKD
jgi:hypothetical protein